MVLLMFCWHNLRWIYCQVNICTELSYASYTATLIPACMFTKIFIYYRIWDKITVGAYRILVFVAVVTLTTLRRLLLRCENIDNVLDTINNVRPSQLNRNNNIAQHFCALCICKSYNFFSR